MACQRFPDPLRSQMPLTPTKAQERDVRTPNPPSPVARRLLFHLPWLVGERAPGVPALPVPFLCPTRSAKPVDSDIWAETAWLVLWKQGHRERPEVGATPFHPRAEAPDRKGSGGNGLGHQSSTPPQRDPEKPSFYTGETEAWEGRAEPRYTDCASRRLVCTEGQAGLRRQHSCAVPSS